jgi:penicillin-binding protein 2
MAGKMNPDGFYLFDRPQTDQAVQREEQPRLLRRLRQFVTSRYALLAAVLLLSGALIFYNTAVLQLSPAAASSVGETTGVPRQLVIKAPRGDIVDANGIPLAYSRPVNVLQIAYAGLDSTALNRMLLDLALFLEAHDVHVTSRLSEYLLWQDDEPVFAKSVEELVWWQTKSGVFSLKAAQVNDVATFNNSLAKTTPQLFYDYLLYGLFKIENPEADGLLYSPEDAYRIMCLRMIIQENNWAFLTGTPLELSRNVSEAVVAAVNEQNYRFMGVVTSVDYERVYTAEASLLSHTIGYIGSISADQYQAWRTLGYAVNAQVGQSGVESSAERYLAGQDGIRPYNTWSVAGPNGAFYSEEIGRAATPGYDVRLTIDLNLQTVAESSLKRVIEEIRSSPDNKNKGDADAGAVVMLDVRSGAVLAIASYPAFDPNDFVLQLTDPEAADRVRQYLSDQVNKPMWNRAIMEIYAPGSTFKAATAVAGLESGAITPTSSTIRCKGSEVIGDWLWRCLERPHSGHGDLNLTRGLATSCNLYFFNLGVRTGINAIAEWAGRLGLGEYTGIDLPGESKGFRASRETKKLLRSNPSDQIWFPADTCQSAIGQFDNSFTILQLAVYTAALATGNRVTPYVIDTITRSDGVIMRQTVADPVSIGMKQSTLDAVRKGMLAVTQTREGTAYRYFTDFPIAVAAKTGTAETGFEDRSSSNGLFICYAPADNPQVAIAQIVEKGAWGSNTIAIARDLLTAYFHLDATQERIADQAPGLPDFVPTPTPTAVPNRR